MYRFMTCCLAIFILAGCQASTPAEMFAIKPAWDHKVEGLTHYSLANGDDIWVQPSPIVTIIDVKNAWYVNDKRNRPAAMIEFDAAGTARISRFSSGHDGQPLAIFIENLLISAPNVTGTIKEEFMVMGIGDKAAVDQFITNCLSQAASSD